MNKEKKLTAKELMETLLVDVEVALQGARDDLECLRDDVVYILEEVEDILNKLELED